MAASYLIGQEWCSGTTIHNLFYPPPEYHPDEDAVMNRTYFGDTRDLFKFDLVRHIMKAMPGFESFTFVPMLTERDDRAKGKKSVSKDLEKAAKNGRAGSKNTDLVTHMARLQEIEEDLEYFQGIQSYFKNENILVVVLHRHTFSKNQREKYFKDVFAKLPKKSVIFLDPDIGLEESSPSEKHLLFNEVKKIFDHLDMQSVMMIYQHFPRQNHDGYRKRRCQQLEELVGSSPVTITDNEIVFFLMAKNTKLQQKLEDVLEIYASTYPVLESGTC